MRIVIAGAGSVGRSIARELLGNGHEVLLVDKEPSAIRVASVPDADTVVQADDIVHVLIDPTRRDELAAVFAQGPEAH